MKHFTLSERFAAGRETRMSRRCAVLGLLCLLRLLRFTARFSAQSAKHRINPQLQHG